MEAAVTGKLHNFLIPACMGEVTSLTGKSGKKLSDDVPTPQQVMAEGLDSALDRL